MLLKRGSTGPLVKALQEALGLPPQDRTGYFGPMTEQAVRRFQVDHGLTVDGIVGPETAAALGLDLSDDPSWPKGLDAAISLTASAECIKAAGYTFTCRYYNVNDPDKSLTRPEALALSEVGLDIVTVWENGYPTAPDYFGMTKGIYDGEHAAREAQEVGQPAGTPIYFAVDFDAQVSDLENIDNYFRGVAQGLTNGGSQYAIGAYGSGRVLAHLQNHPHVNYFWLAGSTGWSGYDDFNASRRWNIRQGPNGVTVCGMAVDLDVTQGHGGGWSFRMAEKGGEPDPCAEKTRLLREANTAILRLMDELTELKTRIAAAVKELQPTDKTLL